MWGYNPHPMARKDHYSVLGVERQATAEAIRAAYRKLARQYHPDVNKSPDAATRFAEVQEAYEVLSDAEKRKAYDRFGHAGVGVGHGTGAASPYGRGVADPADFASFFQDIFGGGAGGGGAGGSPFGAAGTRAGPPPPRAGANVSHSITVSFMTAALGGSESIRLTIASGATQTIDVKIPSGIESGANLRVRGQGQPGHNGGSAGDLILTIGVGQHPYFRRQGLDLLIDLPITVAESAFGASVTVPLLKGTAQLSVPPGTSSGQKLRIKGKGIEAAGDKHGDYYAVIQIVSPEPLSKRGQEILEELGRTLRDPRADASWAADLKGE